MLMVLDLASMSVGDCKVCGGDPGFSRGSGKRQLRGLQVAKMKREVAEKKGDYSGVIIGILEG